MEKRVTAVLLLAFSLLVSQSASADLLSSAKDMMGGDALLNSLSGGLDLDAAQAGGSLGSILSLAQNKLPAADYASLASLLPSADNYIKMAQDAGVLTDPITDIGRLNAAMDKLGISPDTASSLYSQLGDYVGKAGSDTTKEQLMALLK